MSLSIEIFCLITYFNFSLEPILIIMSNLPERIFIFHALIVQMNVLQEGRVGTVVVTFHLPRFNHGHNGRSGGEKNLPTT